MAYYEYDDLNIWETVHFPLPGDAQHQLLSEAVVKQRLDAGEDVVAISIEKWQGIKNAISLASERFTPHRYYKNLLEYINYKTCSLCIYSMQKYTQEHGALKFNKDKCTVCPLAAIDCCVDPGSTFSKIINILETGANYLESRDEAITADILKNNHKELEQWVETMLANIKKSANNYQQSET